MNDFDFLDDSKLKIEVEKDEVVKETTKKDKEKQESKAIKTNNKHIARRATSEVKLLDLLDNEGFAENDAIHIISMGDIDSFSFLRAITRKQKINYCIISTWCIGKNDVADIENLLKKGVIKKIDVYGGEILQNTYPNEYARLKVLLPKYDGKLATFRNHSKVYVILGEKFDCVIESSANVNTNPRTEQTVITVSSELAKFYKDFYDNIKSF